MILSNLSVFFAAFLSLFLCRKLAKAINLVDSPNARKNHRGNVPLVGGVAVFIVVFSYLWAFPQTIDNALLYLTCAAVLLFVGVIDDLKDISFKLRLLVQVTISLIMVFIADLALVDMGAMLGPFELNLGYFGVVVTIIAVVGAINAFNMVDGIDGLLGGLATVTFGSMAVLFYGAGFEQLLALTLVIIVAILPYILMNLGIPFGERFKIFMGDAGSTVIGFTIVWLLLSGSQGEVKALSPVTALWIAAIPIMDAVSTITRRIKKKQSPFKPDREHLHHILQRLGFGPRMTLFVICAVASLFAVIGVAAEVNDVPEYIMFYGFILCQLIYNYIMMRIWRVTVMVRRVLGISNKQKVARKKQEATN